jgi:hypothetical protein
MQSCRQILMLWGKIIFPSSALKMKATWSWDLLEKLSIVQLLKNFPAFYGTWKFITMFTRALHWSLSIFLKYQYLPTRLYGVTTQNTKIWTFTVIKLSKSMHVEGQYQIVNFTSNTSIKGVLLEPNVHHY